MAGLAGLAAVMLAGVAPAQTPGADGVGLLISNAAYGPALTGAPHAHRSADAVKEYLVRDRGFPPDRIVELRDAGAGTLDALLAPAGGAAGRLAKLMQAGDTDLFVYYAGYGTADSGGTPGLLAPDGSGDGYPVAALLRRLADLPARRVTVVLEARLTSSVGGALVWPDTTAISDHLVLLAAAAPPPIPDGRESVGGGLFTRLLLSALSGHADADGDGRTTVTEVRSYMARELPVPGDRTPDVWHHAGIAGAADWVVAGRGPPAIATADGRATVLANASLRRAPTTGADRLEVLAPGTRLEVIGTGRDRRWVQVRRGVVTGFVFAPLLRLEPAADLATVPPAEIAPRYGQFLLLDDAPLRAGPSVTDVVVAQLRAGIRLQVTGAVDGGSQLQVTLDDGRVGFLAADMLRPSDGLGHDLESVLAQVRAGLERSGPAPAARAVAGANRALLSEVYDRIASDYVETVTTRRLLDGLAAGIYRAVRDNEGFAADGAARAGIDGMIATLDRHSGYLDAKQYTDMQVQVRGEFAGLGIEVTMEGDRVKVVAPIDATPAARAGLQAGDLISHLDGDSVGGMSLTEAVGRMRGRVGTAIRLTVERTGQAPFEVVIVRDVVRIQAVRWQVQDGIGYVRITTFNESVEAALRQALKGLRSALGDRYRGLILDLRNNPGGLLKQAVAVSDAFLESGEIVSLRGRAAGDVWRYRATRGDDAAGRAILVLINEGSASAAEIVAGALQDQRRAVVAGVNSFGKGSVQTIIPLRNGGALRLTTARYYRPSGVNLEGEGVRPDVELETEGLDLPEVIDRARRLLMVQSATPSPGLSGRQ